MSGYSSNSTQATALPPRIIDYIHQELPQWPEDSATYSPAKSSGTTTSSTTEPRVLFTKSVQPCLKATASLFEQDQYLLDERLKELRLATVFDNIAFDNEQAVVTASLLYLLRPILEVLKVKFGSKWTVHSEFSAKANKDLQKFHVQTTKAPKKGTGGSGRGGVRYDLVFRTSDGNKAIALLEYKKRATIRYGDYQGAFLRDDKSEATTKKVREMKSAQDTELDYNAVPYVKQVTNYAKTEMYRHVALVNCTHLLLFEFHQLATSQGLSAGEEVYLTWVNEDNSKSCRGEGGLKGDFVQHFLLRELLLGWLMLAFEEALGVS